MGAIIIRADQKSSKLLKELAVQLGAVVTNVKDEHYEDFILGTLMDSEKTGEIVSREEIFKKLEENAIKKSEKALTLESIPGSKKLIGFSKYYRIKMGDYRLGFERINSLTIRFIIFEYRKDIYKKFP